jgi:hypothetical protein
MLFVLLAFLVAAPPRPFNEERVLLDRRLETLRRILPDGPNPVGDATLIRELAEGAKVAGVDATARPPLDVAAARADMIVDVVGVARFGEIDRFFRQVALSYRLLDVESVTLTATPEDVVRMQAVVRIPYRPTRAPLPPPPEGLRGRLAGVPRPTADAFLRDQALALAKSETIAAARRQRRNPRLFLSELAAIARDRPVVLTYASLGEDFTVRGLAVGEGPVRALETRFERGFFRVTDFLMARQGACHRFEVKGRSPVAGTEAELPLPTEDPFDQDDTPCRVERDPSRPVVMKAPPPKAQGQGTLSLRLRDVDVADVFRVLNVLTGQAFVVDGDVTGRASMDLSRLSLEDVLAAAARAGFDVSEPAPIRRVSMPRTPSPKSVRATGGTPTASFALKRAEVREALAVMTDADPGQAALGPQGSLGRMSLWARDVSLADLRAAVLDSAGLAEKYEEGRRVLRHAANTDEAVFPVAGTPPERRLVLRPQDLAVLEFELAGLASAGDAWIAFAYAPTGTLNTYKATDRLADGIVKTVESTDVVLETEEGPVRVEIPPLPR